MAETRKRGISASVKGLELLQEARANFEGKRFTYEKIADEVFINEKTIARFFQGKRIDKPLAFKIIKFFNLSIESVISHEDLLVDESIRKIESESDEIPEHAQELIKKLQSALDNLKREEEINHQAMDWLKTNRKALAQEAAESTLNSTMGQECFGARPNNSELEKFSEDIRKYLQLVYYSLDEGSWAVIDGAIQESLVPANLEVKLYTEALTFIKDQKVVKNLSVEISRPIIFFIDYLIMKL
jgi:transcriptional regulator with XRE-family HTH domain